jgi:hypothetical protein
VTATPRITSDDPRVAALLGELVELLRAEGAEFHPALELVCARGSMSMRSDLPAGSGELLVLIPEHCAPSIHDFRVVLENGALACEPGAGATPVQAALMDRLVGLYNVTGKLAEHATTVPWFAFAHRPTLLAQLSAARSAEMRIAGLLRDDRRDEALIASYFDTRCLHAWGDRQDLVMPIVDLANHHVQAPGLWFGNATPGGPHGVGIRHWRPTPASDGEVYCCYSQLDALDLYARCGFADESADVVQSVPLTLPMPGGGAILVRAWPSGLNGSAPEQIPARARDITAYFPRMTIRDNRSLGIAFLLIPPARSADALRRVLAYAIGTYCSHYRVAGDLGRLVAEAEERVLAANIAYFDDLRREVEQAAASALPAASVLDRLITQQLERIARYRQRAATVGWAFLQRG